MLLQGVLIQVVRLTSMIILLQHVSVIKALSYIITQRVTLVNHDSTLSHLFSFSYRLGPTSWLPHDQGIISQSVVLELHLVLLLIFPFARARILTQIA